MTSPPTRPGMPPDVKLRFGFSGFLFLVFAYTTYASLGFRDLAQYLPLTISVLALVTTAVSIIADAKKYRATGEVRDDSGFGQAAVAAKGDAPGDPVEADDEPDESDEGDVGGALTPERLKHAGIFTLWMLGYVAGIAIIGIEAATGLFLVVYLYSQAKAGWLVSLLGPLLMLGLFALLRVLLNIEWPPYVFEPYFTLPF